MKNFFEWLESYIHDCDVYCIKYLEDANKELMEEGWLDFPL